MASPIDCFRNQFVTPILNPRTMDPTVRVGPGLLESVYEECLCYELSQIGLRFERQVRLPLVYKGIKLDCGHILDLVVEDSILVELKSTEDLAPVHHAQLLTYLKSSNKRVGLLINFNVPILKNGLKRIVNHYAGPALKPQTSADSAFEPLLSSPRLRGSASRSIPRATEALASDRKSTRL